MQPNFPAAFEAFVAPARARPQLWRLLAGLCLTGLVFALWSAVLLAAQRWWPGNEAAVGSDMMQAAANSPWITLILMSSFLGLGLGAVLAARLLHRRRAATLFGRAPVVLHDFALSTLLVGAVYGLSLVLWFLLYDPVPKLSLGLWLAVLPLSLLALLVQTGAEELVFRGYMQQQLAARFRAPLIWLVLPSLLFGLAHYDPETTGPNLWPVIAATTIFGLAAADLTARTGSLGAAWGFHFANNIAALLVVAVNGTIPGLALFTTPYGADDPAAGWLIGGDILTLVLAWFLVRRVLSR